MSHRQCGKSIADAACVTRYDGSFGLESGLMADAITLIGSSAGAIAECLAWPSLVVSLTVAHLRCAKGQLLVAVILTKYPERDFQLEILKGNPLHVAAEIGRK